MTFKSLSLFYSLFIPILIFCSRGLTKTIRLDIQNNCPNTIWAAAVPGGGKRLNKEETWTLDVEPSTKNASIWARTGCKFNRAGRGKCESGDCSGLLECPAIGQPPHTLAKFALNQYDNIDFFDISLLNGFNVPIEISPTSENCSRRSRCVGDVNWPCPQELRDPGGCNNPCSVFRNDQFCCSSGSRCEATHYSKFFKAICPDALTYPNDWSTFTCPSGSNYKVVFCPNVSSGSQNDADGAAVADVVTQDFFNGVINKGSGDCPGKSFYTRDAFLNAANTFNQFASGSAEASRREIAAFFAQVSHITEFLCKIDETGGENLDYCDETTAKYPCNSDKKYFGRGPLQLTWNFNYGAAGKANNFDGLNAPETVGTDAVVSFKASLWFWMENVHGVISQGFGATTRKINAALECDGKRPDLVEARIINYYNYYCNQLGVSPGENVSC